MTVINAALVGSFPRPKGLARLVSRFNSGRITREKLEEGYELHTKKLFKLLTTLRIKYITDGMFRWDDIFNPLISYVDGVKVNGLYRFYDNNFFFRAPQVVGRVSLRSDCPIPEWFKKAKELLNEVTEGRSEEYILKPVLPGPLTLAKNSLNEYYRDVKDLIRDYTFNVLEPLMKDLKRLGASVIEIHEPELAYGRASVEEKSVGVDVLSTLIYNLRIRAWVHTYFGDACRILNYLIGFGSYIVGIDLTSTKDYNACILQYSNFKSLALGLYDSRSTVLERSRSVRWCVSKFVKLHVEEVIICNNAPMDFIPEVIAVRKLRKLSRVTERLVVTGGKAY